MHRHAAGRAKLAPKISFVARTPMSVSQSQNDSKRAELTDVAPDLGYNRNVVAPYQSVDCIYDIANKKPCNNS